MTQEPGSLAEAIERNAQAVMAGNLAQLMADITPEALTQVMRAAADSGASTATLASLPAITGYDVQELGAEGEEHFVHVTFHSAAGRATVAATWKQIMGQWKMTAVSLAGIEPATPEG